MKSIQAKQITVLFLDLLNRWNMRLVLCTVQPIPSCTDDDTECQTQLPLRFVKRIEYFVSCGSGCSYITQTDKSIIIRTNSKKKKKNGKLCLKAKFALQCLYLELVILYFCIFFRLHVVRTRTRTMDLSAK